MPAELFLKLALVKVAFEFFPINKVEALLFEEENSIFKSSPVSTDPSISDMEAPRLVLELDTLIFETLTVYS